MLNIAVCDDNKTFREQLFGIVDLYMTSRQETYCIKKFASGEELINSYREYSEYDIVLLDIEMGELNGIAVAEKIRLYSKTVKIIFVTAYINYAPEGYKVNAYRYVIKNAETIKGDVENCLRDFFIEKDVTTRRVLLKFSEGSREQCVDEIVYVESIGHFLKFHLMDGMILHMTNKLDIIQDILPLDQFCRIHKSYLVNFYYIESIKRYSAILHKGEELSIAKVRYASVKDEWLQYRGFR